MRIILASASPYRGELLARLGLPFDQAPAAVDETPLPGESAAEIAQRLAVAKAQTLTPVYPGAIIIGSDQTVDCNGTLLGKPGDFSTACAQLEQLSGNHARFYTAIALRDTREHRLLQDIAIIDVSFRNLERKEIERYLRRETPFDCAGSFKVEGLGISLLEAVHSDDPTALIGLPLISLRRSLAKLGVPVP